DNQGIVGLRDDVVLVHLRAGGAQFGAEQALVRRGCASARVGTDGRAGVEGGLDAFSKTLAETHVEGTVGRVGGVEAAGGSAEGRIVGAVAVGGTRMAVGRRAWPECV